MAWKGAERIVQDVRGYIEDNGDAKVVEVEAAAQSEYSDTLAMAKFAEVRIGQPDRDAIQKWPIAFVRLEGSRGRAQVGGMQRVHMATRMLRVGTFVRNQDTETLDKLLYRYIRVLKELLAESIPSLGYDWGIGDGARFDTDYGPLFISRTSRYSADASILTTCLVSETKS